MAWGDKGLTTAPPAVVLVLKQQAHGLEDA